MGGKTGAIFPFQQEQALRLAQLLLTSWFNSGRPSPRKDLGRGWVIPSYKMQFNSFYLFLSRFEIEIEPIFASLALYDVKEKKKVGF